MNKIPMKESVKYPEPLSLKVTTEVKQKLKMLKEMGVNVGELSRIALAEAIDKAIKQLDERAS